MPDKLVNKNSLAIIGSEDVVLGFQALGFKVYAAKETQDCKSALDDIVRHKTSICLLQDNFYDLVKEEIAAYKSLPLPVFIPFAKDSENVLLDGILKNIRLRATGAF